MNPTVNSGAALVDTSILIDLFKCGLLPVLPKLLKAEVLDVALIQEINDPELQTKIRSLGYIVLEKPLEADTIETVREKSLLSDIDTLYLYLASESKKKCCLPGTGI